MCSHACAFWIIVAPCTHLMGSCDTNRLAKEICHRAKCARTALMANSNALAAGVKYTHLHMLGVWWQRAPILFPVFCIDRAEHLEIHLCTVVRQRFADQLKCS